MQARRGLRATFERLERRHLLSGNSFDINTFSSRSGFPQQFVVAGDFSYFIADSNEGRVLWQTDGTTKNTHVVRDNETNESVQATSIAPFGDSVVLEIPNETTLYQFDGKRVAPLTTEGRIGAVTEQAAIALIRTPSFDVADQIAIHFPDGSEVITDHPGPSLTNAQVLDFRDDRFFYRYRFDIFQVSFDGATSTVWNGTRWESSTKTNAGLVTFSENLAPFHWIDYSDGSVTELSLPDGVVPTKTWAASGNLAYVIATKSNTDGVQESLFRTDGTPEGTFELATFEMSTDPSNNTILKGGEDGNGGLLFVGQTKLGQELWYTDGTVEGTQLVKDIAPGPASPDIRNLRWTDDRAWFIADDQTTGAQLWTSDGTTDGTLAVTDFQDMDFDLQLLEASSDQAVFSAGTIEMGVELWKTTPQPSGVELVSDINPGPASSAPSDFTRLPAGEFLFAASGIEGRELWLTDLTQDGTRLVKDLVEPGLSVTPHLHHTQGSSPGELTVFRDELFFVADDGSHGREIWKSDGESTPQLLRDIRRGEFGSAARDLTVVGDKLFFVADDGIHGTELWETDGTTEGTQLVQDLLEGEAGSSPVNLVTLNDELYFIARFTDTAVNNPPRDLETITDDPNVNFPSHIIKHNGEDLSLAYVPPNGHELLFDLHASDERLLFYESDLEADHSRANAVLSIDAAGNVTQQGDRLSWREMSRTANGIEARNGYLLFQGSTKENTFSDVYVWRLGESKPQSITTEIPRIVSDFRLFDHHAWVSARDDREYLIDLEQLTTAQIGIDIVEIVSVGSKTVYVERLPAQGFNFFEGDPMEHTFRTRPLETFRGGISDEFIVRDDVLYFSGTTGTFRENQHEILQTNRDLTFVFERTQIGYPNSHELDPLPADLTVLGNRLYFTATTRLQGRELHWVELVRGDINTDGQVNNADIDALSALIADGEYRRQYDFNLDNRMGRDDVSAYLLTVFKTLPGDADLNGDVEFADFLALSAAFGQQGGWSQGDFDGDGEITFADFLILSSRFGSQ